MRRSTTRRNQCFFLLKLQESWEEIELGREDLLREMDCAHSPLPPLSKETGISLNTAPKRIHRLMLRPNSRFCSEGPRIPYPDARCCPSELHSLLASKVSTSGNKVSLVTIEYDIRDDKPQTTEVIHIEAIGPGVAEQLLLRRFPCIGQNNAHRIAEFADGNARVSLAIAERVEEGESLAQLSDAQLFNRLFEQRNHSDENLREQAEILSLVYSFSVSAPDMGYSELEVLGSLSGHTQNQLFRAVKNLLDRHIVQKRSHWRAILPHAIANKLASSALDSIPVEQLRATFEASGHQRFNVICASAGGLLHNVLLLAKRDR